MPVELDPEWPGLTHSLGRQVVDLQAIAQLATALQQQVDVLKATDAGTLAYLQLQASMPGQADWFGRWQLAQQMQDGYTAMFQAMTAFYGQLVEEIGQAVATATAAANQHADTDELTGAQIAHTEVDHDLSAPR